MSDKVNWNEAFTAGDVRRPPMRPKMQPKMDKEVSELLGFNVPVNDPKLIRLFVQWKKKVAKDDNDTQVDNFLKNPDRVAELKQAFGVR